MRFTAGNDLRDVAETTTRLSLRLAAVAVIGLGAVASYYSLRWAYADRVLFSLDFLGAARLEPTNNRYQLRAADQLEDSGRDPSPALWAALSQYPGESAAWMRLGLRAELDGKYREAEEYLLRAAEVDHQYAPRWTLMNFYFRRNQADKFWPWARKALIMAYGDFTPIFRLCWELSQDADLIFTRAIPDRDVALSAYLYFLLAQNRLEAAEPVARKLQRYPDKRPELLAYCDHLLRARQTQRAVAIWNVAVRVPLSPEKGELLPNADFRDEPKSTGFDWRLHPPDGVTIVRQEGPPLVRVAFSGRQPEVCEILSRFIPLAPGKAYEFEFEYRTEGVALDTGLHWRLVDSVANKDLIRDSPRLSSQEWRRQRLDFTMPAKSDLGRLVLYYQRTLGTTRIEGTLWLRGVALRMVP